MEKSINTHFKDKLLDISLRENGVNSIKENIANVPLKKLKEKVIISVQDDNHNYVNKKEFNKLISISGKNKSGNGMPYVYFYRNLEIVEAYDPNSLKEENKQYLGISYPDFTNVSTNSPASIHHTYGIQFVTMNFHLVDEHLRYYLNLFNDRGTAFILKPKELRYQTVKIDTPPDAPRDTGFIAKQTQPIEDVIIPS